MDAEAVLRYWTLQSPTGGVATCELVRTPNGLEVRCDWTADGARARVARAASIAAVSDALKLAESWRAAYIAEGWMARAAAQRLRARR
jgi:hypothetical protein